MKKTLFLSAILGAALCSSAMGAVTTWNNTVDQTIGAGTTVTGHFDTSQTWGQNWSILMSVDATTLSSGTAYTLMGTQVSATNATKTGVIEGANINSDGKINFTTWSKGDIVTADAVDFSAYKNVVFVLSREGGGASNLTLKAYDADSYGKTPVYTLASTVAQNFGSFRMTDVTFGGLGSFSKYADGNNHVAFAADADTGSYTLNRAGYTMGTTVSQADLLAFMHADSKTLVWGGTDASAKWDTENAWIDSGDFGTFSSFDSVEFWATSFYTHEIAVDKSQKVMNMSVQGNYTLNMGSGAMMEAQNLEVTENNTLTVNGAVTVHGALNLSGKLAADDLYTANALYLTMAPEHLAADTLHLTASSALTNGTTTQFSGKLVVENGVTLTTTADKLAPSDISSLSAVELDGGTIKTNSSVTKVKDLTVTANGGRITYNDFQDFDNGIPTVTDSYAGVTTLNGALTIYTEYKSSATIERLTGSGSLTLSTANRNDGGNRVTINSLEGFTGDITLHPGSTNNKVDLTIDNDVAPGTVGTILMKEGSYLTLGGDQAVTAEKILMTGSNLTIDGTVNTTQLMMSKEGTVAGSVTIKKDAVLHVTGTTTSAPQGGNGGSLELCNWAANNTVTIYGQLIAESGITTEGGGSPVVNIENGGTLTMNAGLTQATRQGSPMTTINVKDGATLELAGTSAIANANNITVNLKDGSTLAGAYGSGTTAHINKNMVVEDNAEVTLKTATGKNLTVNGTLSNATASAVVTGGGTLSLGGMAEMKTVTVEDNTALNVTSGTAIESLVVDGGSVMHFGDYAIDSLTVKNGEAQLFSGKGAGVDAAHQLTSVDVQANATLTLGESAATIESITLGTSSTITLGDRGDHNFDLTVNDLTVNGNASMNANLVMVGGTLSFIDADTTLTMGCTVTIGEGSTVTVVVTDDMVTRVAEEGRVALFTSVDSATLGGNIEFSAPAALAEDAPANGYALVYVKEDQTIYLTTATPEPATATLSLLALAGLMARRRRH